MYIRMYVKVCSYAPCSSSRPQVPETPVESQTAAQCASVPWRTQCPSGPACPVCAGIPHHLYTKEETHLTQEACAYTQA